MPQIRRALLSVTDKTGLVAFAQGLHALHIDLISTGGTSKILRDSGLPVKEVSDFTGFPEMLDGRVKTMHPKIMGGILAIRNNPAHREALQTHDISTIDMVVVNLYEFEKIASQPAAQLQDLIEHIDIGGPSMIRAAAKNYQDVAVVTAPADYPRILEELRAHEGALSIATTWELARKAFACTAAYDRAISNTLNGFPGTDDGEELPPRSTSICRNETRFVMAKTLTRQPPSMAQAIAESLGARQLHGKELSYNNLVDLDAAWALIQEFHSPAAAIIKHTNPAGCAEQGKLADAYLRALECDPISAFGGVVGLNREVDEPTAHEMIKLFLEAVAAPCYSDAALEILKSKKNLRLLEVKASAPALGRQKHLRRISRADRRSPHAASLRHACRHASRSNRR